MLKREVRGGWYSDCLNNGLHCCLFRDFSIRIFDLFNSKVVEVPLPEIHSELKENVLFLRMYYKNSTIYLAGQGHISGDALLWNSVDKEWVTLVKSFGTNVLVFADDYLYVTTQGDEVRIFNLEGRLLYPIKQQIGVNGIRLVLPGDKIITGDETYNGSQEWYNVAEFTPLDDYELIAGQSYSDGTIITTRMQRKKVEPGDCKFIRFYKLDSQICIAIVKQLENKAVFYWFNESELVDFPDDITIPIPPDPNPIPPNPNPGDEMKLPADVLNTRDRFIQKFPWPLHNEDEFREWFGRMLQQIVFEHPDEGYGWKSADGPPSKDVMANNQVSPRRLIGWDMFTGVGTGTPIMVPSPDSMDITGQTFIPVAGWNYLGSIPNPSPIPPTNPALEIRVTALEATVKDLQNQINNIKQVMIAHGTNIALRTSGGFYQTAEDGGGLRASQQPVATDRTTPGAWETYGVEKQ